jgi:hypothetical protein
MTIYIAFNEREAHDFSVLANNSDYILSPSKVESSAGKDHEQALFYSV